MVKPKKQQQIGNLSGDTFYTKSQESRWRVMRGSAIYSIPCTYSTATRTAEMLGGTAKGFHLVKVS